MLQVGIVGLPNVGKSTLFNALTASHAPAENYPFTTVDPNVGVVEVPDERLDFLYSRVDSRVRTPAHLRFVDIAGLVKGASRGAGLGNRFLSRIREVDAVAHVVRCFDDPDVAHVTGPVDPVRDREVVEVELALADLETVERRLERVDKKARAGERDARVEAELLREVREALGDGRPVRALSLPGEAAQILEPLHLLTAKPVLYVANVGEDALPGGENPYSAALGEALREAGDPGPVVAVCGRLEAELGDLEPREREEFLRELGIGESGLRRFVGAAYGLLDLVTFFTTNERETRAWTVPRGTRAPEAAGRVHSDFERGFIRAETLAFEDFRRAGSLKAARESGLVRSEGKEYVVQDGDILLFRFRA